MSGSQRPHGLSAKTSLPVGFSRQDYWSGLPFPPPGDLPDSGIKPGYPALQADALLSELLGNPNDVNTTLSIHPALSFLTVSTVHSLCLCPYSRPANRVISSVFLDSIYMQ